MSDTADRGASPTEGHTEASAVDAIAGIFSSLEATQEKKPREQSRPAKKVALAPAEAKPESTRETEPDEEEDELEAVEGDDLEPESEVDEESEQPGDNEDEDDDRETGNDDVEVIPPVRLEIDGEEVEVPFEELKSGYLRQSDYTRKTQALAAERKKFQSEEMPALRAQRQEYATLLTQLTEAVESYSPGEPDWEAIKRDRPQDLAQEMLEWQQYQDGVSQLKAQQERAMQQALEDRKAARAAHIAEERDKLLLALPEWKSPEVSKREKAEMVKYANEALGFDEAEIAAIADHRALVILRKAMLYDRAEADRQKAKKVAREKIERATQVARPGTPQRNRERMPDAVKARLKAQRTGREEDAVAAIMHILPD